MARQKIIAATLSKDEQWKRLRSNLEEHRHLIQTAVKAMADGDLIAALTIAVSIRTLIHESGRSKPLLKNLKTNYLDLSIMDRPRPEIHGVGPGNTRSVTFYAPISVAFSSVEPKIRLNPNIIESEQKPTALGIWWNKPFIHLPGVGEYNRRTLILDVADKEAVHSDLEISEQYKQIMGSQFLRFASSDGKGAPVNIPRLLVGKAGVQILNFLAEHFPVDDAADAATSPSAEEGQRGSGGS